VFFLRTGCWPNLPFQTIFWSVQMAKKKEEEKRERKMSKK
jgi:hypothetical protein